VKSAYPTLTVDNREIIAKGAFLGVWRPSIKRFTVIGSDPTSLDDAVRRAVQQEIQEQVYDSGLSTYHMRATPDEMQLLHDAIASLTREVKSLKLAPAPPRFETPPFLAPGIVMTIILQTVALAVSSVIQLDITRLLVEVINVVPSVLSSTTHDRRNSDALRIHMLVGESKSWPLKNPVTTIHSQ